MPKVGREGDQTMEEARSGGWAEGGAVRVALGGDVGAELALYFIVLRCPSEKLTTFIYIFSLLLLL